MYPSISMDQLKALAYQKVPVKSNTPYPVRITHINSVSSFYVTSVNNTKFTTRVNNIPRNTLKKSFKYNVGDTVFYEDPAVLKRGLVLRKRPLNFCSTLLPEFEYDIRALDFGYVSIGVKRRVMWNCSLLVIPLAFECQLDRCKSLPNSEISCRGFRLLTAGERPLTIKFQSWMKRRLVVDLCTDIYNVIDVMIGERWVKPAKYNVCKKSKYQSFVM